MHRSHSTSGSKGFELLLLIALACLLALFPFGFGGNRSWMWGSFAACLGLLAIALGARLLLGHGALPEAAQRLRWLLGLVLAWLLAGAMQWLPLVIPGAEPTSLSLDPGASLHQWLKNVSYALVFLLTIALAHGHSRLKWLLYPLVAAGLLQAMAGSVAVLFDQGHSSTWFFLGQVDAASGTFVNRNHLAGFLLLTISIGIGLLVGQLRTDVDYTTWQQRVRDLVKLMLSRKMQLRMVLIVMVVGLVLTRSRMGNVAFFSSLLLCGLVGLWLLKKPPRFFAWFIASVIAIDVIVIGSWFGLDQVVDRLSQTRVVAERNVATMPSGAVPSLPGAEPTSVQALVTVQGSQGLLVETDRVEVAKSTLAMWSDSPWLGIGGGAFRAVYPGYRSDQTSSAFYDHAHNDFAQFLAEYGLLGACCFLLIVLICCGAAALALRSRHDRFMHGVAFASLMGITALLIHGIADFNLQIPANAAVFWLLLALAWIALKDSGRGELRRRRRGALAVSLFLLFGNTATAAPESCRFQGSSYLVPNADPRALRADIDSWRSALARGDLDRTELEKRRDALALLATHAMLSAERMDALGQAQRASAIRTAVQELLADTRWRISARAEQGDRQAIRASAEMLRHGVGSPVDDPAACEWLARLKEPFQPDEQYRLAQCMRSNDPDRALDLMQSAARGGHPAAAETLGLLCLRANPPDALCALDWLCRAGAAGRLGASAYAAFLLTDTNLDVLDYPLAEQLYRAAAEAGDVASQNNLGEIYEHGRVGTVDLGRAELWYSRAAQAGNARAQLNVARVMLRQLGEKPWKRNDAMAWLRSAARELPDEVARLKGYYGLEK